MEIWRLEENIMSALEQRELAREEAFTLVACLREAYDYIDSLELDLEILKEQNKNPKRIRLRRV